MLCLARTGDGPDQRALFLVPLDLPGVKVHPVTALDGSDGWLASLTLTGVGIPADALLGPAADGLPAGRLLDRLHPAEPLLAPRLRVHLARLNARLQAPDADDDLAGLRRQVAELEVDIAGLEALELRALAGETADGPPALAALLPLKQAAAAQRLGELQVASLGYYALPFPDALRIDNEGPIGHHYALSELADMLRGRSWSIDGDAGEIHKNQIARTILGF
jgi:hypothetical protein